MIIPLRVWNIYFIITYVLRDVIITSHSDHMTNPTEVFTNKQREAAPLETEVFAWSFPDKYVLVLMQMTSVHTLEK